MPNKPMYLLAIMKGRPKKNTSLYQRKLSNIDRCRYTHGRPVFNSEVLLPWVERKTAQWTFGVMILTAKTCLCGKDAALSDEGRQLGSPKSGSGQHFGIKRAFTSRERKKASPMSFLLEDSDEGAQRRR